MSDSDGVLWGMVLDMVQMMSEQLRVYLFQLVRFNSLTHSLNCTLIYSLTRTLTHSFAHSLAHSVTLTRTLNFTLTRALILCSLTRIHTHSHSLTLILKYVMIISHSFSLH